MSDLTDLYQELILDHNKNPQNFGTLSNATNKAEGHNPLCGDIVNVELILEDSQIKNIAFNGHGCAISKASASMMTQAIKDKKLVEVIELFDDFQNLITGKKPQHDLGKLEIFESMKNFPTRVKCASLPWHTMKSAITNGKEVTTE